MAVNQVKTSNEKQVILTMSINYIEVMGLMEKSSANIKKVVTRR